MQAPRRSLEIASLSGACGERKSYNARTCHGAGWKEKSTPTCTSSRRLEGIRDLGGSESTSSVNTHRTQEHRVKRSTRTHPSSGLISTRLVPRMTAKPSERVLGGTAGRPVSGSAIGANEPQEGKFLCPFPGLLTSEELTVQSLLDIVHHQVEKLIVSLQGARDYDW